MTFFRRPRPSRDPWQPTISDRHPADQVRITELEGALAVAQLEIQRLGDKLATEETLREQAEQSLAGVREENRFLRRENRGLNEANTRLRLSGAGDLHGQISKLQRQLLAQENLLARYEGRDEQAVTP